MVASALDVVDVTMAFPAMYRSSTRVERRYVGRDGRDR